MVNTLLDTTLDNANHLMGLPADTAVMIPPVVKRMERRMPLQRKILQTRINHPLVHRQLTGQAVQRNKARHPELFAQIYFPSVVQVAPMKVRKVQVRDQGLD